MKDIREETRQLVLACKNRIRKQEQENKDWKTHVTASLAVKKEHTKECITLEQSKVERVDNDIEINQKSKEDDPMENNTAQSDVITYLPAETPLKIGYERC